MEVKRGEGDNAGRKLIKIRSVAICEENCFSRMDKMEFIFD